MFKIESDLKNEELEAERSSFKENSAIQQKRIQRLEEALNIKEEETERLSNFIYKNNIQSCLTLKF